MSVLRKEQRFLPECENRLLSEFTLLSGSVLLVPLRFCCSLVRCDF